MKRKNNSGRVTGKPEEDSLAVVGLGHLAQVAVLPAFKNTSNSTLAAIVSGEPKSSENWARSTTLSMCTRTTTTTGLVRSGCRIPGAA